MTALEKLNAYAAKVQNKLDDLKRRADTDRSFRAEIDEAAGRTGLAGFHAELMRRAKAVANQEMAA